MRISKLVMALILGVTARPQCSFAAAPAPQEKQLSSSVPMNRVVGEKLLPELADGSELMPLSFIRNIQMERRGNALQLKYRLDEMDRLGARGPIKDGRLMLETTWKIDTGIIIRTDRYTPVIPLKVNKIELEYASFSVGGVREGTRVDFGSGEATKFEVGGLTDCKLDSVADNEIYRAPTGQMKTRVSCQSEALTLEKPFTISWTMHYR
jgi:hypothetical protein